MIQESGIKKTNLQTSFKFWLFVYFRVMFLISPIFSVVGIALCLSIIILLNFLSPMRDQNWGSISQALIFHQVIS